MKPTPEEIKHIVAEIEAIPEYGYVIVEVSPDRVDVRMERHRRFRQRGKGACTMIRDGVDSGLTT